MQAMRRHQRTAAQSPDGSGPGGCRGCDDRVGTARLDECQPNRPVQAQAAAETIGPLPRRAREVAPIAPRIAATELDRLQLDNHEFYPLTTLFW
jgi:hypothetical protein